MRRLAYADPPYPGQAGRYANGREVNHELLVAHLREFDGWALSTSAAALLDVWKLAPEARCAAWLKTYASNGWSRVRWSWEPVLFVTDRKGLKPGERSDVWDGLVCAPNAAENLSGNAWAGVDGKGGGSKPYEFVQWVLRLLDYEDGDELVDIFPGSGSVTRHAAVTTVDLFGEAS